MPVAEDVDLVWRLAAAGWRVRYDPAARVAHEHPVHHRGVAAAPRRLRHRAAPLAARHGALVAPVVISPWSAAALALGLAGGWPGRAAGRRRPGPRRGPPGAAPGPSRRPAAVRAGRRPRGAGHRRGRAHAGPRGTRHHWPLALAAAVASRRARRAAAAVAVADAVLAWWPHRAAVGPLRFAAARRLEDLAYGAGLWAGAVRARDARALLPARPPGG
jgi:hypothetical protein